MKKFKFSYKKFVTIVLFSTILSAGAATTAFSFSWFSNRNNVGNNFKGETAGAYFARGDGTEEKPYVINRPVHLYNLAWLQYIGYFKGKECYFIIERDLDMTGWVLPPIGSTTNPFTGHLDGYDQSGKAEGQENHQAIIKNLTVSNDSDALMATRHPSSVTSVSNLDVVGVFGMLGEKNATYEEKNTPNVSNLYFKDLTVNDISNKTLAGLAAGYVNGLLTNVGVAGNSKINVSKSSEPYDSALTQNISNYTTVGYCEDKYKTDSVEKNVSLASSGPTYSDDAGGAGGSEQGFGGSIDMNAMYNDLLSIYEQGPTNLAVDVPSKKTITYDFDGTSKAEIEYVKDGEHDKTTGVSRYYLNYDQKNENNEISSSYSFTHDGVKQYMTLYGRDEITSTITTQVISRHPKKAFYKYISYDGNYLSIIQTGSTATGGATYALTNTTNINDAISWRFDEDGTIYAYPDSASQLYLYSTDGKLSLGKRSGTSVPSIWTYDEAKKTLSSASYNLAYNDNDGWYLETSSQAKITDMGHTYWIINNGTSLSMINGTEYQYQDQATVWDVDSNGRYSTLVNNTKYYLSLNYQYQNVSIALQTNPTYPLTYSTTTKKFSATVGSTTYYMTTSNNGLVATTNTNQWQYEVIALASENEFALEIADNENKFDILYDEETTYETPKYYTNDTFFPISGENGVPDEKNTGYVISGAHSATADDPWGDIRVSIFKKDNLSKSGISTSNNTLTTAFTVNDSGIEEVSASDYQNYTDAKGKFEEILAKDNTNVSGLHFMSAQISKDNLVTAPYARIKDDEYRNYQLPEDSIDFNLQRKGYVNFFAGTYFPLNNSFFSLHEIERNRDTTIKNIREISEIYKNPSVAPSQSYVYKYSDGTYSVPFKHGVKAGIKYDINTGEILTNTTPTRSKPSGYDSCIFKTSWIGINKTLAGSDLYMNGAFYFEIPVNAGEYALGSVSGGKGAYLCYLDIGANAQRTDVTSFTEIKTVSTYVYSYPKGVSFSFIGDNTSALPAIDAKNNASFTLGSSFTGKISVSRTDTGSGDSTVSSINYESSSNDAYLSYKGASIEVTKNGTDKQTANGLYQGKEVIKSLTKIGYSLFNETVTTTRYEMVSTYNSNDTLISSIKDVYTNDVGGGDWIEGIDDEFAKDADVINKANLTIAYTMLDGEEVNVSLVTNFNALDMDETGHYYHELGGYTIVLDTTLECEVTLIKQDDASLIIKLKTASDSTVITLTLNNTQTVNKA